jgi:Fusaric acid resistance protein family
MKIAREIYGTQFFAYFRSRLKIPTIDYDAWIYALRAACAGCLALYISFSLNLAGSHWALTTCYIVGSERQSGRILAKSAARIVGTLVGVMASFAMVNPFAHERWLFIFCFAAWLSLCVFFAHYQRGHWAYAWVLSGYTTAIIGVPAALAPDQAFSIIMSSRKRHHWHSLHGRSQLDCFSGDCQSIFSKTSAGGRCGIDPTIIGLPVFRVGLCNSEQRVEKANRECASY